MKLKGIKTKNKIWKYQGRCRDPPSNIFSPPSRQEYPYEVLEEIINNTAIEICGVKYTWNFFNEWEKNFDGMVKDSACVVSEADPEALISRGKKPVLKYFLREF